MKKLFYTMLFMATLAACNNKQQNDNGAKEPEPVAPASEVKSDSSSLQDSVPA